MDSPDSPFADQPPIFTADFAFIVIFAVFSFGQLVLLLLLTVIKMTRKPQSDAFGTASKQEVGILRFHRGRFTILMTLSLISLIIMYSTQAATVFYGFIPFQTYLNLLTTNFAFWEIHNVFFSLVLIALLDSGIKMSQLPQHGSMASAMQGGTNVNIIVMSCIVAFLIIFAIARIVVVGVWHAEQLTTMQNMSSIVAKGWAQFGLAQVRIFINVVLAIYYSIVAILMWRKRRTVPNEPNKADKNNTFHVLDRTVMLVCPLLLLLTLDTIISDPVGNTIIPDRIVTTDEYLIYLSFTFADDFVWGLITFLLNLAIISVGYAL